ncbi:hypothetical protein KC343_g5385, partial [Hortaea werneckii]
MGAAAATATAGGQGGVYQDRYGGYWEMDCGYYFSGNTYYDGAYQGTNGIGVYSCFNGCANRPGCVGFTYYGTSTGPTTGGGRCFHFYNGQQGNLNYNTTYLYPDAGTYSLFGSAYLLQASENLLCPTYNGTYFLDAQGQVYYILCGYGSTSQYQNTAARDGPGCLALCDAQAQCIGVTVVYGGAESNANNNANCYLASAGLNTIANTRNVLAVRTTMPSSVPTTTTTTTTTSSAASPTSAAASGTCTFAVSPTGLPTNCGGRSSTASFLGVYNDTCGVTYSMYCHVESNPQQADTASASSISACMALCDNYVFADNATCQSATLYQGRCYLKRSFDSFRDASTDTTVMVRNSNQNLLLANSSSSTTTTSTRSSAAGPVTPTAPPPSFFCPADDIQQLQENGQNYYVGCGMVAQGTTSTTYTATNSWNDCFGYCDATVGCTGFTYEGAVDGNGAGTCFLRNSAPIGLVPSDSYHIGAVKAAYYGFQVTTTTTTTTSSSRPFTTTTTSTTTTTTSSSSSAAAQTVTYTYVSSYPVTYTTSYVTTAVSTAPGSQHIRDHGACQTNHRNIHSSGFDKYTYNDGNINRTNHGNIHSSCINKYTNNHSDFDRAIYRHFNRTNHLHSSGIDKYIDHYTKDHRNLDRKDHSNLYRAFYCNLDRTNNRHIHRAIYCDLDRTNNRHIHRAVNGDYDGHIYGKDHGNIHRAINRHYDGHIYGKDHGNIHRAINRHYDGHINRATNRHYDGHINRATNRHYDGHINRATNRDYDGHIYRAIDRDYDGHIYRANHGTSNPNLYDCIIIPSHHGDCKHSIWLDHNPDYKLLCNIHGNQHDSGLFDWPSPNGDIYDCRTDSDTNYGILIRRHIYHFLPRHGYGNYIDSRLNRHFHLRLVCHKYIRFLCNFDDHTAYDGRLYTDQLLRSNDHCSWFNGKNHRANDDCVNSTSIDNYPNSANYSRLYVPLDNPGHRDLYNTIFLSLHIHACQHCFWLYYHGNFGSLSNDHPNITPSIDCREHRLFNDCIYPDSIRTNGGFNGHLYHKLRFDLSDIISGDNDIGSTVTTESISYATSTERTTIVSSYISTATETTTASGPTQTVSGPTQTLLGPTQTESGPTQTISGPTQTVSGPTQTQVITTSYVETYTTSYPVTETLPGSTEVTISYATTTIERTVVSSYISTERISVTQTQEVTTTQAGSTLYGTTTQPGVTIYGTVTAT